MGQVAIWVAVLASLRSGGHTRSLATQRECHSQEVACPVEMEDHTPHSTLFQPHFRRSGLSGTPSNEPLEIRQGTFAQGLSTPVSGPSVLRARSNCPPRTGVWVGSRLPRSPRLSWAQCFVEGRQLLNHLGRDWKVTGDLTVRSSDTMHHVGHELFVDARAALTMGPGTLVRVWRRSAAGIVESGARNVSDGTRDNSVALTCAPPLATSIRAAGSACACAAKPRGPALWSLHWRCSHQSGPSTAARTRKTLGPCYVSCA